jgi:UDP-3-O-[3-hydroxymyristoyl] glucosamine N-acyltransferase
MEFTAQQIALLVKGTVEGDPATKVSKLAKIEEATAGSLTFLSHPKYVPYLHSTGASVIIITEGITDEKYKGTIIKVKDSRQAFTILMEAYNKQQFAKSGIEEFTNISITASVAKNVYVGSFSYIGENTIIEDGSRVYPNVYIAENCKIGKNCIIYSGVKIYRDSVIGDNCTIHSGVVVGSDGFGFVPNDENNYRKMPQVGNVVIENNVEIGSNTSIDRATMGSTVIHKGVKLDNLIQIGHNVEIGENTVIAAQSGVAGSTKIGRDCMIGGQVGIVGHLTIGNRVKIAAQSGIGSNVEDDSTIQGSPALDHFDYKKAYVIFRKLPELNQKVKELAAKIESLIISK